MKEFIKFIIFFLFLVIEGCSKLPDLGNGYRLTSNGKYTLKIVNHKNTILIGTHILDYAFDSTFIVASQRPRESIPNFFSMTYSESLRAFEDSDFIQYWIINKKEANEPRLDTAAMIVHYSNVYGPFRKEEYLLNRLKLGVPDNLQLNGMERK